MQSTIIQWAVLGALACLIATAATGCTYSCSEVLACESFDATGGGEPDPCPEDPADGAVAPECGVWVSASLGDDSHAGTQAEPVRTIGEAVLRAQAGAGRIYACGETYLGQFEVPSGVSLAGGFTCDGGAWKYAGRDKPARLVSTVPDTYTLTLLPGATDEKTSLFTDIEVEAVDAVTPGGSSIAVFSLGAMAIIRRAHLIAGNGADGIDGEAGDHNNAPAKKGLPGNDGESACMDDPGLGGASVELQCEPGGVISAGGQGGDGGKAGANDGLNGLQPPDPNPLGYGAGGKAESASQACTGGISGAQGASGAHGLGANGPGHLTKDGYVGVAGGDGFAGTPGQGGGGGGGSIGSILCGAKQGGAGGGSGGTGGCGGKPGRGGRPGGSSIGVAVVAGVIRVHDVRVDPGNGGNGGNGGAGQLGGQGGLPGLQGMGFGGANGVKAACAGGAGGAGGNGGNGGGGRGGHSLGGLVAPGAYLEEISPIDVDWGNPGLGGEGGNPSIPGTGGELGIASDRLTLKE